MTSKRSSTRSCGSREDAWDSIAAAPTAVPLPDWRRAELNRRLHRPWAEPPQSEDQVRTRLRKQRLSGASSIDPKPSRTSQDFFVVRIRRAGLGWEFNEGWTTDHGLSEELFDDSVLVGLWGEEAGFPLVSRCPGIEIPTMDDVDPVVRRLQINRFREMTPQRKLELAWEMRQFAWELCAADQRARFPALSEAEVSARVRHRFLDVAS
jgi:hypothetical protein